MGARTRRRHELRIAIAESALAGQCGHALLESRKPAVLPAAAAAAAVNGAPRIVLRLRAAWQRTRGSE